jgi:SPP1 gp7 family putative phage head morphogenesis protein
LITSSNDTAAMRFTRMMTIKLKDTASGGERAPLSIGFDVSFPEAIAAAEARGVVLPDVYYRELQAVARQKAFSIAGLASLDQLQAVKDSLDSAIANGQSFGKWKKQMLDSGTLELPRHRLDNIYRTNLQGQYMAGKWERFKVTAKDRPYLMYDAINDSRTRPAHLALDGVIRAIDDPFWLTHSPMCGYRCRCSLRSLSDTQAQARSHGDNGLNKQPQLPDGTPANPDQGWDYDKRGRMTGVDRAIKDKTAKAEPKLVKALKDRVAAPNPAAAYEEAKRYVLENGKALESKQIEFAYIFDGTGRELIKKQGGVRVVEFTPAEVRSMEKAEAVTLTHNHPSSASLSWPDIRFISRFEGGRVVAVGHNGAEYIATAIKAYKLEAAHNYAERIVKDKFYALIAEAKGNKKLEGACIAMANQYDAHAVNTVLDDLGVISYEVRNAPEIPAKMQKVLDDLKRMKKSY